MNSNSKKKVLLERERLLEESELRLASVPPGPAFDVASYASALLPLHENITHSELCGCHFKMAYRTFLFQSPFVKTSAYSAVSTEQSESSDIKSSYKTPR